LLLLNATSLHKTNAVQHLATELKHINSDFGFIVETWFKCDDDALVSIDSVVYVGMAVLCVFMPKLALSVQF